MDIKSEILFYNTEDGKTRLQVKLEDETVWLTQKQIAELFDKNRLTITEHIKNVFSEGELIENSVCRNFRHTAEDGKTYDTQYYNLDVIISVGYRVKSQKGTQFRIWATQRLKEYVVKGFTLDDERLKQGGKSTRYFQELLQRIRDIRSSERNFYQNLINIGWRGLKTIFPISTKQQKNWKIRVNWINLENLVLSKREPLQRNVETALFF